MNMEKVYHYTSLDSTKSILLTHTLRATNVQTLDDKSELIGGVKSLKEILKEILDNHDQLNGIYTFTYKYLDSILNKDSSKKFYIISFCKDGHSDFMWENYAKWNGCCIVFIKDKIENALNNSRISSVNKCLMDCSYVSSDEMSRLANEYLSKKNTSKPNIITKRPTNKDLHAPIEEISKDLPPINLSDHLNKFLNFALLKKIEDKNHSYMNERETRYIFHPKIDETKEENSNTGKKYIEPQIDESEFYQAISEIRISPLSEDKDKTYNILNEIIKNSDKMKHIKIGIN